MGAVAANDFYYLGLIVLFPLIGALINGVFGSRLPGKLVNWIGCGSVLLSFFVAVLSVHMMVGPMGGMSLETGATTRFTYTAFEWIYAGDMGVDIAFMLDSLSAVMVLVVTGVGFLIHVYSTGYMADDPGKWKYFSYLNFFLCAMLLLVLGKNLIVTFIGWEGVGACSYLLIGFWYTDDEKAKAGQKAFIVNRVGDFAFIIGLFLLYWEAGTFDYVALESMATNPATVAKMVSIALPATLLIFIGCTGKSAQIPLYTWLPDAMAGPTPVSALIHAATMVTSGVYLLGRLHYLVTLNPYAMMVIAGIGALTAFVAATIALVQNDIKRVLAYSTVSQLGYMFIGIGSGAFIGAVFHLMTHAFFKALLFLGSGSVIHACAGNQDIRKMGGLNKYMPVTNWTFFIACLAIAGVPLLAGFFSKDLILWGAVSNVHVMALDGLQLSADDLTMTLIPAFESGARLTNVSMLWQTVMSVVFGLGLVTAALTAFYMFRLYILTFTGEFRGSASTKAHLHESPVSMILPLSVLGFLSIFGGWFGWPHIVAHTAHQDWMLGFEHWLMPLFSVSYEYRLSNAFGAHPEEQEIMAIAGSITAAVVGIFGAYFAYRWRPGLASMVYERAQFAYRVLDAKYYVDEAYDFVFVRGSILIGNILYQVDRWLVDGAVNLIGVAGESAGHVLKSLQSGDVQRYATYIVLALVLTLTALWI